MSNDATYVPSVFSIEGRIGRLRYLAYTFFSMSVLMFVIGIVAAIAVPTLAPTGGLGIMGSILMIVFYLPVIVVSLIIAKRRLNDLNQSGWLSLLLIVPLVNFFFGLYLLFAGGTQGTNNYGLRPSKNSTLVILGLLLPVVIIAVLAAVAIPAYQKYSARAKAVVEKLDSQVAPAEATKQ